MDYFLEPENSYQRLLNEYRKYGSLVIAFDFDDTVFDFHKQGRKYEVVIGLLRNLKKAKCYLICWTGQENVDFVRGYLLENKIPFDSINENPPFYKSENRKVYANAYLDDRAGLSQVYRDLIKLLNTIN
ncbi:hypothetical protein [Pollutibacter soli]|uniref:hypothetical protein n=1 Tax=Pollutibacter soli TaxID=3034157 RepID=UPI0030133654